MQCVNCRATLVTEAAFCHLCGMSQPLEAPASPSAPLLRTPPPPGAALAADLDARFPVPPEVSVKLNPWFHPFAGALSFVFLGLTFWRLFFFRAPDSVGLAVFAAFASWIPLLGLAIVVGIDAWVNGSSTLKRSRLKLTDTERMHPLEWALCSVFLAWIIVPWYWAVRRRLAVYAAQTRLVGRFPDRQSLRHAKKNGRSRPHASILG